MALSVLRCRGLHLGDRTSEIASRVPQSSEIASRAPQSSRRRVSHRGACNVLTVLSHSDAHPHAPQCLAVDRARDALTTLCLTNADTAHHSASVSAVATVSRRCSVEYDPIATSPGARGDAWGAGGSRTATT